MKDYILQLKGGTGAGRRLIEVIHYAGEDWSITLCGKEVMNDSVASLPCLVDCSNCINIGDDLIDTFELDVEGIINAEDTLWAYTDGAWRVVG